MALRGKGFWIWKIGHCDDGDPVAIAQRAVDAKLTHVLIKIADGSSWVYNYNTTTMTDKVPPVAKLLHEAGIEVWGWHYVYGDAPRKEARLGASRVNELNLDGYVIDAEGEYKQAGKRQAAVVYMEELRKYLPKTPIALSTYRYPRLHTSFPFVEFLERCDIAMPQVYWIQAHNPVEQLERSLAQYTDMRPARPYIPVMSTYSSKTWSASAQEITDFMQRALELGLTAVNGYSWDCATRPRYTYQWDAVADFDWPTSAPQPDISEIVIGRMNQSDPVLMAELYQHNAAHVTGARTVLGTEAVTQWYADLFSRMLPNGKYQLTGRSGDGTSRHFTWTATSDNGLVADGTDTVGLRDGRIQFHYTYFTIA